MRRDTATAKMAPSVVSTDYGFTVNPFDQSTMLSSCPALKAVSGQLSIMLGALGLFILGDKPDLFWISSSPCPHTSFNLFGVRPVIQFGPRQNFATVALIMPTKIGQIFRALFSITASMISKMFSMMVTPILDSFQGLPPFASIISTARFAPYAKTIRTIRRTIKFSLRFDDPASATRAHIFIIQQDENISGTF